MSTIDNILSKLQNVKKCGDGYQALCPAHDDKKQSLHISQGEDDRILLYCHAGCSVNAICGALGLRVSDLFPDADKKQVRGKIVAIYDYKDENGKLLFQVCRTEPKGFFQRRPDGKGGWINGLGDIKPIPYRLPEIMQAVKNGETIFIPEGEKDVDNLVKIGLDATTSPMGAGKWRSYYSDYFKGAQCVILPDNDEPGRKHALQVAESLKGKAANIKILELPDLPQKGDVSDWLAAGGSKEDLLRLVEETPEWEPPKQGKQKKTAKNDNDKNIRQTSFYVDGDILYEQVYNNGNSEYLAFNTKTGEVEEISAIETDNEIIEPIQGEDVELGAVKLPSGIEDYGDTLTLLNEIENHINKYLDVSSNYLKFAAYYVLLSWVYDRFNTLPYLRALGDTGCGKSRFLDTIGGLCYKAISASGCVTPAPIYRMLRKWQGTLVLDEADMKNSDEYNEVITILNCGFEKGRPVIRATKDNPDKIQILPVYGPKVFATRRRFKDVALEARCLTEIMRETDRTDIPPVLGRVFYEEQQHLRNKLLLFRFRSYYNVNPEGGETLDLGDIEPRLRQISDAFVSLFAKEPEVLESYKEFIKNHQRELIEERAATKTGQVVETLFELLKDKVFHVPTVPSYMGDNEVGTGISAGDIAEKINSTPQAVGAILKGLGLETKRMRQDNGNKRVIVYDKSKFEKLKKRYILSENDEEQDNVPSAVTTISNGTLGTLEQDNADAGRVTIEI